MNTIDGQQNEPDKNLDPHVALLNMCARFVNQLNVPTFMALVSGREDGFLSKAARSRFICKGINPALEVREAVFELLSSFFVLPGAFEEPRATDPASRQLHIDSLSKALYGDAEYAPLVDEVLQDLRYILYALLQSASVEMCHDTLYPIFESFCGRCGAHAVIMHAIVIAMLEHATNIRPALSSSVAGSNSFDVMTGYARILVTQALRGIFKAALCNSSIRYGRTFNSGILGSVSNVVGGFAAMLCRYKLYPHFAYSALDYDRSLIGVGEEERRQDPRLLVLGWLQDVNIKILNRLGENFQSSLTPGQQLGWLAQFPDPPKESVPFPVPTQA